MSRFPTTLSAWKQEFTRLRTPIRGSTGCRLRRLAMQHPGVGTGLVTLPDMTLHETTKTLGEVRVAAKKPIYEQQVDRLVVNVLNSITAAGGTALEVLERSPADGERYFLDEHRPLQQYDSHPEYQYNNDISNRAARIFG